MKILLDTCVVLDYLQARDPYFDDVLNIMIGVANREYAAYITASSVTDLYYIVHRSTHSDQLTRSYMSKLFQLVGITDTSPEDCINALHSTISDYEDAVMVQTAVRSGMDLLITRNLKDYRTAPVRILDPASFIMMITSERR